MRKNTNHGSVQFYLLIAIVLGIITFFEFAFVEWQGLLFNNDGLILWSLYILSIIKFFLVVMFFMHLWGDHKLLTQLFTAGMVVGSITVAIMLMLFTADNMNRYRVEQPVSVSSAHGGGHGGGHGDEGHVEIPVRDFAETLARPAPKSQQYALAPRENIDAGSLNLPTISLPAIDQGVQPTGSLEMIEPEVVETTTTETATAETATMETTTVQTQVVETVATPATTETVTTETVTTETVTTEVVASDAAASDDLTALRAQVEALRLELEAMENELPSEVATTVAVPAVTETVTTAVTQAAPTATAITTNAAAVGAATNAATSNISASTTPEVTTEVGTETTASETAVVETVSVSFDTELGNSAYMGNCLACHQMNGEGIPGAFPPLKGHMPELYNADGGRDYLIQVVLYGLQGEITAGGMTYNGMMTPWSHLDDNTVAAILNHELTSWGNDALVNDFSPITAEEVAAQRATPLTAQEVLANRVIQ